MWKHVGERIINRAAPVAPEGGPAEVVCWRRLFVGMASVETPRVSLSTIQREVSVVLRAAEDPAILTFKQVRPRTRNLPLCP